MAKNLPCAICGTLMFRQATSRPDGEAVCHSCRKTSPQKNKRRTAARNSNCQECGKTFTHTLPTALYCSAKCRGRHRDRENALPCTACGGPTGYSKSRGVTDAKCRACQRESREHGVTMYKKRGCRCEVCKEANNLAMREYVAKRKAEGRAKDYHTRVAATCARCGAATMSRSDAKVSERFCSVECQKVRGADHDGPRWKPSKSLRSSVLNRDGWVCQLCDGPINASERPGSKWYATLDHIHPRSLGGSDDIDNLRAAHMVCNAIRGNRVEEAVAC